MTCGTRLRACTRACVCADRGPKGSLGVGGASGGWGRCVLSENPRRGPLSRACALEYVRATLMRHVCNAGEGSACSEPPGAAPRETVLASASLPRRVASPHGSARARVPRLRAERGAPPVPRQSAEGPWSELPPVGTPGAEARPVQQLLRVHFKRRVQHTRHLCVREVGDEKPAPRPCVGERADEGELTIPARLCHIKTASNSTRWSSQFLSVGQIFRNGLAGRFWPGAYPGASAKVSARAAGT